MATNLNQQDISSWREQDEQGALAKSYIRLSGCGRIIEKVSTRLDINVGGPALRYTAGFVDADPVEIKAEKYEMILWTQTYEDYVNGIQSDGTLIP